MVSSARWKCVEFVAPAPLAAVAVLIVNDQWLKLAFHNTLTGKLSDFAGCYFLPLYVSALLGLVAPTPAKSRLLVGALVTAVLFISVSTSRAAADGVCDLLAPVGALLGLAHYRIAADPSDLIALPMIVLAYRHGAARLSEMPEATHAAS